MEGLFYNDKTEENLLINSRLFGKEQLRQIILMRKQYETKIRRKEKPALLGYIESEKEILRKTQAYSKTKELSQQIILRIIRLYKIALSFFKDDLKVWLSYIKFCTEIGNTELVTETFPWMLQIHTEKRLWHLAAKWELTQFNNLDKALNYLYRGLHFNPSAPCLYTHIYKLELSVVDGCDPGSKDLNLIEKQRNAESKALNVFEMTTKITFDIDFYIEILKIASEYTFTNKLQSKICEFMAQKYLHSEIFWNSLAQRELEGHHLTDENKCECVTNMGDRIRFCIKIYQQAIEKIPTDVMWEKYLNTLVDLHKRYNENIFVKNTFISTCEIAHKKKYMSEKHYVVWLECLNDAPNISEILKTATKNKPHYAQLWIARIRYHFKKKEENLIEKIFDEAINALGDNSIQIWQHKLQYYQLKCDNLNKIETIFREGLEFSSKISLSLQPQFLEWIALFRSRNVAHDVYKELSKRKPFCIELHKKMAELEAMCSKPSEEVFKFINNVMHENPNEQGEWKEYICQEIHYGPTWRRDIYKKYL